VRHLRTPTHIETIGQRKLLLQAFPYNMPSTRLWMERRYVKETAKLERDGFRMAKLLVNTLSNQAAAKQNDNVNAENINVNVTTNTIPLTSPPS